VLPKKKQKNFTKMTQSMSGVKCDELIRPTFEEQLKKTNAADRLKFMVCKIADDKSSIKLVGTSKLSEHASNKAAWEAFSKQLPDNDSRYGIFLFEEKAEDGSLLSKIIFLLWAPDAAPVKSKMLATSSLDAIKTQLPGIQIEIQATDNSERDYQEVWDKIKSKSRA